MRKAERARYLNRVGQLGCTWLELDCSNPSCVIVRTIHVKETHGTRGHAECFARIVFLRTKDTTLRLPEVIGERERKGSLNTDQRRRETMGSPTRGDPHGDRAVVVIKGLG